MSKGLPRSMSRGRPLDQEIIRLTRPIRGLVMPTTDAGASNAWGTLPLVGLPQGNVLILGGILNLQATRGVDGNLIATFASNFSLGTAATADATLSGNEVNIIASTAMAAAVAGISSGNRLVTVAGTQIIDNTDNLLSLNLNASIPDASSAANSSLTLEGFLSLAMIMLGDD